jgi:hypothetical protein
MYVSLLVKSPAMKAQIEQIRDLLKEIEASCESLPKQSGARSWSGFELPGVVLDIVDDLQPLLSPYETAFYWHAFAHSIAQTGAPYIRLSTRGLRRGPAKSSRSPTDAVSLGMVQKVLRSLEAIGAIRKEGEANRDGTLYRVMVPDEIEVCRKLRAERTAVELQEQRDPAPSAIDFYNVRENRLKVYERDDYKCRYCGKPLTRFTATLDHVTAVSAGGDNSIHNLVTACLDCNSRKHRRPVGDFLADN